MHPSGPRFLFGRNKQYLRTSWFQLVNCRTDFEKLLLLLRPMVVSVPGFHEKLPELLAEGCRALRRAATAEGWRGSTEEMETTLDCCCQCFVPFFGE